MRNNLARLRVLAAERGDAGTPESRDSAICTFLDELGTVVSEQVVGAMADESLRSLYVLWSRQVVSGLDRRSRVAWLASGVTINPTQDGVKLGDAGGNVHFLHARY